MASIGNSSIDNASTNNNTMAATMFTGFATLPYELRHAVWESLVPADDDPFIKSLIKGLASHILAMPRDRTYGANHLMTDADTTLIFDVMRDCCGPSPYTALSACTESRVVALKHVKKLLEQQKHMKDWLEKPRFPYYPKLEVDKKEASLLYKCENIVGAENEGYHLENFIFWGASPPKPTVPSGFNISTSLREPDFFKAKNETKMEGHSFSGMKRKREEEDEYSDLEEDFGE